MANTIEKNPPAKSLMFALRNIGYSFDTALADIIDNSISAQAENISILYDPDIADPYLAIFDDGYGMGYKDLNNAMTLGTDREDRQDSEIELGRFGLGLKSASFSQCLRLTVASKNGNKINALRYDLKKIQDTNSWVIEELDKEEIDSLPEIDELKNTKTGTLVIWQDFDKIRESAKDFSKSFNELINHAKRHVEYVFHRFYDDINIEFNKHRIERRDPFLSYTEKTQTGRRFEIPVGGSKIVAVPYTLPYANNLTQEDKKLLGNPKSIYDEQGLYIYRNKRLIVWGTWLRMDVRMEENKLARVKVDIPSELDSLWTLDVKKSSVKIPDKIKNELRISINDGTTRSKKTVRYPGKKEAETQHSIWTQIKKDGKVCYKINREDSFVYQDLVSTLDDSQRRLLDVFLQKVENYIPKGMIIANNADAVQEINPDDEEDEENMILQLLDIVKDRPNPVQIAESLLDWQGYSKIAHRKNEILGRIKND